MDFKLGTLAVKDGLHNARVLRDTSRESPSDRAPVTTLSPDAGPWSRESAYNNVVVQFKWTT